MSQFIKKVSKKGFTLIELMIVVAIIGILAAIAIPKFAELIGKSKESSVKGNLGSIRGAMSIYYSDMEGFWPTSAATFVTELTSGAKYMDKVPGITVPANSGAGNTGHPAVAPNTAPVASIADGTNGGYWVYTSTATGDFRVNCTHTDTKGSVWSTW